MVKYFRAKNKKDLAIALIGLVLFILLAVYSGYSITFVVRKINDAININLIKQDEIVRFDFNLLEELKKR